MGKKTQKPPTPDVDGYIDVGFGKKEFVGPPDNASEAEIARVCKAHYAMVEAESHNAWERLKNPQAISEWLEELELSLLNHIGEWVERGDEIKGEDLFEMHSRSGDNQWILNVHQGDHYQYVGYTTADDAPPFVDAAIECLDHICGLRHLVGADLSHTLPLIAQKAFVLGRDVERMLLLPNAPFAKSERSRRDKLSIFRPSTSALNNEQWALVKDFISKRIPAVGSAAEACQEVSNQLLTGQFKALPGFQTDISGKRLQNLYSDRNK